MRSIVVAALLLSHFAVVAQFQPYQWEEGRKQIAVPAGQDTVQELILLQHTQHDHLVMDDRLFTFHTAHSIIKVNTSNAIERNNRIYVPMQGVIELVDLKARVITRANQVVKFDRSNLKQLKDEETKDDYMIFALEGVETGNEVEYYYTRKLPGRSYASVYMQFDQPAVKSTYKASSPAHLKYDFKVYNTAPQVKSDTLKKQNIYQLELHHVPGLRREAFSNYTANRIRLETKLAYNTARSKARLNTWADAARTFHGIVWATEKGDDKEIQKLLKEIKDTPSLPMADRIFHVEDWIKRTIQVNENSADPQLSKLSHVAKYKVASVEGVTKLFVQVYQSIGIPCQLVITSDRTNVVFDETFDTWNFLDFYLLYFPETGKFISPGEAGLRYPLIPDKFQNQKGLFVEPVAISGMQSALGTVRFIPALPYTVYTDNLDITVDFNADLSSNNVHLVRNFSGSDGAFLTQSFPLLNNEQRAKMYESILGQTIPDATMVNASGKSISPINFQFDLRFESSHLLEKAGNRILFKVGELIGRQTELYQNSVRQTPIDNTHNRGYDRVIRVNLPQGMKIKNPDDIRLDVGYKDENEVPFLFKSDYTIQGSVLEIRIAEYYKRISAPVERYEDFRKVINAAADFNKVTLILEK